MSITIRFACGHQATVEPSQAEAPQCAQCGETRVQHVQAPAPVFHGSCSGPCAAERRS